VIAGATNRALAESRAPVQEMAARHGIAYLLEGSVRTWRDTFRVSVQLIDTATETSIWSGAYKHELEDLFAVQQEVAESVSAALQISLRGSNPWSGGSKPAPAAYSEFLQGKFFFSRRSPGDLELARQHFVRSLEVDPEYGRAWAGLAGVYDILLATGAAGPSVSLDQLWTAASNALRFGPDLPETHIRLSTYYELTGDREGYERHWKTARELDPQHNLVRGRIGSHAVAAGRYDEALAQQRELVMRDPLSVVTQSNAGALMLAAGRMDQVAEYLDRADRLSPSPTDLSRISRFQLSVIQERFAEILETAGSLAEPARREQALAMAHAGLGNTAQSERMLARLRARPGSVPCFYLAEYYAWLGETGRAFELLSRLHGAVPSEEASPKWPPMRMRLRLSPFRIPLREDSRWEPLVESFPFLLTSRPEEPDPDASAANPARGADPFP